MDPAVVVSPHLDDAVLSCGQFLAGRPDTHLVTVFAGTPPASGSMSTTYDRDSGFRSAAAACTARAREDNDAARFLSATVAHLPFLDDQYRSSDDDRIDTDVAQAIVEQITEVADRGKVTFPIMLLGPAGLVHPDHHVTRRAIQYAAADLGNLVEFWVYEELPARVLWPESVPDALAWWQGMGWTPTADFPGTGPLHVKEHAVRLYASQLWAPEFAAPGLHTVLVPERYYRMRRTTP